MCVALDADGCWDVGMLVRAWYEDTASVEENVSCLLGCTGSSAQD